jgi:hypothetical protein
MVQTLQINTGWINSYLDIETIKALVNSAVSIERLRMGQGGFLSIYDVKSKSILINQVGRISELSKSKLILNSIEKLSWFNENPNDLQSGLSPDGSVRCGHLICAFVGFSEKVNTAIALTYIMHSFYSKRYNYDWKKFRGVVLVRQKYEHSTNELIEPILDGLYEFY